MLPSAFYLPKNHRSQQSATFMARIFIIRRRWVVAAFGELDTDSRTGPDFIPGRILQKSSLALATAVTKMTRAVIRAGVWPDTWRSHWVVPLFKAKSASDPVNYRGVQLTVVASKVTEPVIKRALMPYLVQKGAIGMDQFAFRPACPCNESFVLLVRTWIRAIERHFFGIRPSPHRLIAETIASNWFESKFAQFVASDLALRRAHVVVNGVSSEACVLVDSVFQGTVLGPILWNIFFRDFNATAKETNAYAYIFADDLSTHQSFPHQTPSHAVFTTIRQVQSQVHTWGRQN